MEHPIIQIRKELKVKSLLIRKYKQSRKASNWLLDPALEEFSKTCCWQLPSLRREFRHSHIAYCELRGKNRDQIEKPRETNLPSENLIEKIKQEYLERFKNYEEAICGDS